MRTHGLAVWAAVILAALAPAARAAQGNEQVDWPARFEAKLAELRAQGEPVTFDEVMDRRLKLPDEENSALVFLRAFEAKKQAAEDEPEIVHTTPAFLPELGARHGEAFLKFLRNDMEATAEARALIHEGAKLPRGVYPIEVTDSPYAILLAYLSDLRTAARLCVREASVRAHAGDGAAAADSLFAVRRLSASLGDCVFLIDALVRIAVDSILVDALEKTLGICEMPPERLEMLRRELATEEVEVSLVAAMRAERAAGHYAFTCPPPEELRAMAKSTNVALLSLALGPDARAMDGLQFYALMDEAIRIAGLPDREKLPEAARQEQEISRLPKQFPLTRFIIPALSRAFGEEVKGRTRVAVARAALAVEQWRMEKGKWPESLDGLVPALLDEVPQDPYSDGAILLKRTERGAVVYSVGPNARDDGGRPFPIGYSRDQPDAYDLAFELLDPEHRGVKVLPLVRGEGIAIHYACRLGDKEIVARLLAEGIDVDLRDERGQTPLHAAARDDRREIVELLLEHGADVNAVDDRGRTPAGLAVEKGHTALADLLRQHGGVE